MILAPKQLFLGLLFSNSHSLKIHPIASIVGSRKNIQIIFSSPLVTCLQVETNFEQHGRKVEHASAR